MHYQAVLHPDEYGAPDKSRTRNLLIRSQMLYPVELPARFALNSALNNISNFLEECKCFFKHFFHSFLTKPLALVYYSKYILFV